MGEGQFSPYAVVALRTSMATALLVLIMLVFKRQYLYIYPAGFYGCLLAGALNGIGSIFYYVGLSKLNASVAQMLYALYPLFVALWLQLDGQPPSKLTVIRIVIAGGSTFLLTKVESGNINLTGVIFMLISAALYALHLPVNQRVLYDVPAPTVTVYTLLAMSAVVVPAYFIASPPLPIDPPWAPVLGLTAVTFGSRLMLFLGVKNIGGMQTALLGLAELLVAITFSHILLGETLTRWQWMGTAGLGSSLLLVWFEKPISYSPLRAKGLLSWLQPPDFPTDFYRH